MLRNKLCIAYVCTESDNTNFSRFRDMIRDPQNYQKLSYRREITRRNRNLVNCCSAVQKNNI